MLKSASLQTSPFWRLVSTPLIWRTPIMKSAVATQKMEHTIPLIMQWDETFDVGSDTGTPVDDKDYQMPFKFTGKLNKLTPKLDRPQLTDADIESLKKKMLEKD